MYNRVQIYADWPSDRLKEKSKFEILSTILEKKRDTSLLKQNKQTNKILGNNKVIKDKGTVVKPNICRESTQF